MTTATGLRLVSIVTTAAVIVLAMACGPTGSHGSENTGSVSSALVACANGGDQHFAPGLTGCPGSVTWANRWNLCGTAGYPASADIWSKFNAGITPQHDYWTNDQLRYSGSPGNCSANYSTGFACNDGQPMRVCTPSGTDPEGNHCNWTQCGLEGSGNEYFGGCNANATAGTLCVAAACTNGDPGPEVWAGPMGAIFGCKGSVTYDNRASLCAPGWRVATAYEWQRIHNAAPQHNYWTEDNLTWAGAGTGNCTVGFAGDGNSCGNTPMRVCTTTGSDPEGNVCNWNSCGLNTTNNDYFGGCAGNTTAGTLCVPEGGCWRGQETQVVNNNMVACAGTLTWDIRNQACAVGWTSPSAFQWTAHHGAAAPFDSYWTNDLLGWSGNGSNACTASLGGNSCGTNQPMRLCPPGGGPDEFGNTCNWSDCGLNANSPDEYFGGCEGNLNAGVLCGKADLVTLVQNFQNITTETFTDTSPEVEDACITTGTHRVMRFEFHSRNIGTAAAVLGQPPSDITAFSPIFVYSQSHHHWHIRHFNIYSMVNVNNPSMQTGLKQAFCLEDFQQWDFTNGDPGQFSCGNQGVSPGWEDIYESGLPCQFIIMDNLSDGTYLFSAQTNASHVVTEGDYSNNVTTQHVTISGDTVTVSP